MELISEATRSSKTRLLDSTRTSPMNDVRPLCGSNVVLVFLSNRFFFSSYGMAFAGSVFKKGMEPGRCSNLSAATRDCWYCVCAHHLRNDEKSQSTVSTDLEGFSRLFFSRRLFIEISPKNLKTLVIIFNQNW